MINAIMLSITSELPPLPLDPVLRHHQDLQLISRVYVPLGCRPESVEHQLGCSCDAEGGLLGVSRVVVAGHLRVQVGEDHVGSTSLGHGLVGPVASNGVVAVHNSLSVLVEASNQVEGVVREEPSSVQSFGKQMGDRFGGRHPFDFKVVDIQFSLHYLHRKRPTLVS